jgi:hypothetical protein
MRDIPSLCYLSTQDDLAIMIEGTDGQYYLQAGAILLPGPSLPFLAVPSFYYFFIVSDTRTQASGVSKTKLAFRWTQSIRPATYRTVCTVSSCSPYSLYVHPLCRRRPIRFSLSIQRS